jgi:hypothetical protein
MAGFFASAIPTASFKFKTDEFEPDVVTPFSVCAVTFALMVRSSANRPPEMVVIRTRLTTFLIMAISLCSWTFVPRTQALRPDYGQREEGQNQIRNVQRRVCEGLWGGGGGAEFSRIVLGRTLGLPAR